MSDGDNGKEKVGTNGKRVSSRNSYQAYIRDIEQTTDLLSPEGERHYGKLAFEGDPEAIEVMITSNLRLVISIAKNFRGRGLSFYDLVQEGNIGLMKAVERFRVEKGFRFSTYATWWIRQAVDRAVINQSRTMRVPVHVNTEVNRIKRLEKSWGHELTVEEIVQELEVSIKHAKLLQACSQRVLSLDYELGDEGGATLGNVVEDVDAIPPDIAFRDEERVRKIQESLEKLDPPENDPL